MPARRMLNVARIPLILLLVLPGCLESLTGKTKLNVSVQNYSGADRAVNVTFRPSGTGQATVVDLGTIAAKAFSGQTVQLASGDYTVHVVAGKLEHEQAWKMEPGEHGIEVRVSDAAIELVRIE